MKKAYSNWSRCLCAEQLEKKEYLAADTFLINFQSDEATPPTRYLVDSGQRFGDRGNGLRYGWSTEHTDQARERSLVADQRFDTLIHFELNQTWEFELANGRYEVTVAVGDPSNNDGLHTVNVEGATLFNQVRDVAGPQIRTTEVNVSDGRLTLDQGNAAHKATRIDFVHIVGVSEDVANQNPAVPTITEPATNGELLSPIDVHMEAVGFADADGDSHKSSDWEIWTEGPNEELVWQTLGIEGVERLHTHLGDGIYVNGRAGSNELAENTDYVLRVRHRDSRGAVSNYAERRFQTGSSSTVFSMELTGLTSVSTWLDSLGQNVELPFSNNILAPNDPIIAVDLDGVSSYPGNESPQNAIDGTLAKYLNFGELNSGFIVTPASGPSRVTSFQITTANDAIERDPTRWELFGTNDPIRSQDNGRGNSEAWTLIDSGTISLPTSRNTEGPVVAVDNNLTYASYRFVVRGVRQSSRANSMQIAEIQFFEDNAATFAPAKIQVTTASGQPLLEIAADTEPGNSSTSFPELPQHEPIRIVVEAGSKNLALPTSDLTLTGADGRQHQVFLPAINIPAGQTAAFWVANSGSTYVADPAGKEADFSVLAREAVLNTPYIPLRPGFVVEEVGADYRLPVNIAFVPDPGPNPDDPFYYVTELYGSIQVVTRDGTKHEFATGLLDYNPTGPISGSGEQGLTGIVVKRDDDNADVYNLFVTMLWDNDAPLGNASHYPKVERIDSVEGGLSMAKRTVLLNMQPETQGQSHQISNISIGPDNKLYVHNGDGFDSSTAQDLNQFRGKILRMNFDGSAPEDNPFYNAANGISARDYIYAYGLRNPFGGAWRAVDGKLYEVENGPTTDRFAQVNRGVNYGWDGSNNSMRTNAIYNWNPATAPVNITFVQPETFRGSQFPVDMQDHAFVSQSGVTYALGPQRTGKRITEFVLDADGDLISGPESLVEYVGSGRSTIAALAAGPDGLYFSSLYEDSGNAGPVAAGAKIYRVRYINPVAGDYNIDGKVDVVDFSAWLETMSSNLLLGADGDRSGVVDLEDFAIWQSIASDVDVAAARALSVGQTLPDGTAVDSLFEVAGDIDMDGDVDFSDFLVLSSNFGQSTDQGISDGDLDENGTVDFTDFLILSANFG